MIYIGCFIVIPKGLKIYKTHKSLAYVLRDQCKVIDPSFPSHTFRTCRSIDFKSLHTKICPSIPIQLCRSVPPADNCSYKCYFT